MTFESIVTTVLGAAAVASALLMVTRKNPVISAIWLIANFFCIAGMYLTLHAQFLAVVQVSVYAGAIMVLFLFVIMLLNLGDDKRLREHPGFKAYIAIGLTAAFLGELLTILVVKTQASGAQIAPASAEAGTVEYLGKLLYTRYLFPFEITSFLLLAAIVGAVVLAKKKLAE